MLRKHFKRLLSRQYEKTKKTTTKKTTGYVYDFSVDYEAIALDDILDIPKYLLKKIIWYKNV